MEDREIVALYFERAEEAIRATGEKYGAYCAAVARNILESRQDAEECVSDAYYRAWNSIPPKRPESLRAYLGALVRNAALDRYRANRAEKRFGGMEVLLSELSDCAPPAAEPEEALSAAELGAALSRWLRGLSGEERRLFLRRYWLGEAVKDLAREEGCSPNTAAVRLKRLRQRLREFLEQEGY